MEQKQRRMQSVASHSSLRLDRRSWMVSCLRAGEVIHWKGDSSVTDVRRFLFTLRVDLVSPLQLSSLTWIISRIKAHGSSVSRSQAWRFWGIKPLICEMLALGGIAGQCKNVKQNHFILSISPHTGFSLRAFVLFKVITRFCFDWQGALKLLKNVYSCFAV